MIQAIVFDFGNVLCRVDRSLCNQALATHSRLDVEEVGRRVWGGDIERDAETGRISAQEHFRRIKEAIGGEEAWDYPSFVAEYRSAILPYPAGEAALRGARRLGLRCFILSNTSFIHSHCIFSNETCCTVPELHALSFKLGWMKPDPRCWTWLLERAGLTAADCIYVDDLPEYCAAAAALGFRTIQHEIGANDLLHDLQGVLYSG
jgi:FMN phosphatase YigB (HAD superfamily)